MSSAAAAAIVCRRTAASPAERPIRLLIVDDSAVARAVLSRMLRAQPDFELVAEAQSAAEAIALLGKVEVDIVLLDVEMPETTGLQALPAILAAGRGAKALIVSSLCEDGAEAAVQALALGAADTLPKPGAQSFGGRFSEVLAERLRRIARADGGPKAEGEGALPVQLRPAAQGRIGCLALGASTGGLHAIGELLRTLPPKIGAPILVAQHLPALFIPFFARQLESVSGRAVRVATEGAALCAEEILLAPGNAHLSLEQRGSRVCVRLVTERADTGCMPSVDVTFAAMAEIYGRSALAVVLSGMGRDGLAGSRRLVERGGEVLVQDAATSAVWGMPRAVAEAGLAAAVATPAQLARRVAARVQPR